MMIPSNDKFEQVIIGSYVLTASTVFREIGWKQRRELSVPDEVAHLHANQVLISTLHRNFVE